MKPSDRQAHMDHMARRDADGIAKPYGRVPTPDEAGQILQRFIDSHFAKDGGLHARFSIPVDVNNDDDTLMDSFIRNARILQRERDEAIAEAARYKSLHERSDAAYRDAAASAARWESHAVRFFKAKKRLRQSLKRILAETRAVNRSGVKLSRIREMAMDAINPKESNDANPK